MQKLGHGLLTYVLVEEGLKTANADVEPTDGEVDVYEWLEYAARRVPEIQQSLEAHSRELEHGKVTEGSEQEKRTARESEVQHPRVFYRRERDPQPFIIAKLPGDESSK